MASANVVPPDSEFLIFAVDVVHFFLNKHHPHLSFKLTKTDVANNVDSYRPQVRKLFTNNVEKVFMDIDDTQLVLVRRDFLEIQNKDGLSESSLEKYSASFKSCNLDKDFQAGNFLIYCARIASMASEFYTNGCNDALDVAVHLIKSAFPDDKEKCNSIVNNLENSALKYANDSAGEVPSFLLRRELDPDFSGTEDSSSSSAFTSESESTMESRCMSSASSDESLTALILRLNASVMKDPKTKSKSTKSKTSSFSSCATAAAAATAESSASSIQNPTVSSSSSSRIAEAIKCDLDMSSKIESYFKGVEGEPTLLSTLPDESARKSSLGKRPSPRKGNPPQSLQDGHDSETEVKKPKLGLPETDSD